MKKVWKNIDVNSPNLAVMSIWSLSCVVLESKKKGKYTRNNEVRLCLHSFESFKFINESYAH